MKQDGGGIKQRDTQPLCFWNFPSVLWKPGCLKWEKFNTASNSMVGSFPPHTFSHPTQPVWFCPISQTTGFKKQSQQVMGPCSRARYHYLCVTEACFQNMRRLRPSALSVLDTTVLGSRKESSRESGCGILQGMTVKTRGRVSPTDRHGATALPCWNMEGGKCPILSGVTEFWKQWDWVGESLNLSEALFLHPKWGLCVL